MNIYVEGTATEAHRVYVTLSPIRACLSHHSSVRYTRWALESSYLRLRLFVCVFQRNILSGIIAIEICQNKTSQNLLLHLGPFTLTCPGGSLVVCVEPGGA